MTSHVRHTGIPSSTIAKRLTGRLVTRTTAPAGRFKSSDHAKQRCVRKSCYLMGIYVYVRRGLGSRCRVETSGRVENVHAAPRLRCGERGSGGDSYRCVAAQGTWYLPSTICSGRSRLAWRDACVRRRAKKNDEIRKCRAADNTVPAQRFKGPASGRARPVPCLRFGSEDNATCRHCP